MEREERLNMWKIDKYDEFHWQVVRKQWGKPILLMCNRVKRHKPLTCELSIWWMTSNVAWPASWSFIWMTSKVLLGQAMCWMCSWMKSNQASWLTDQLTSWMTSNVLIGQVVDRPTKDKQMCSKTKWIIVSWENSAAYAPTLPHCWMYTFIAGKTSLYAKKFRFFLSLIFI